ncbi:MAG: Serine/threonine-protein kinase PrkC, partial [Planctomycetota bacterium]
MGIFDKLFNKKPGGPSDSGKAVKASKSVDIEGRFERLRSAISGTMSNFFVAKDRQNEN